MKKLELKKSVLLIASLISSVGFSQKKIELNNDEIQYLASSQTNIYSGQAEEALKKWMDLNNTIFFYELNLNGKVLFSEVIDKSTPFSSSVDEMYRGKNSICLNYKDISPEVIMSLLENGEWKSTKVSNTKIICNKAFPVFMTKKGNEKNNYKTIYLPNKTKEGLEVKVYKLIE